MTSTDELNWTPPSPERRQELFRRYGDEGHFGVLEPRYLTSEAVEAARANDWPAAHLEVAPADEYRPWCICGVDGPTVSGWREARTWIRRHREEAGLDWQEFIPNDSYVAPHLRDHEVWLDLDEVARRQGHGGWVAFCECGGMSDPAYYASYADAYAAAVDHAAEHDGGWMKGEPRAEEDYERTA